MQENVNLDIFAGLMQQIERKRMERESKIVEKRKEIEGERASLIERTENLFRASPEEEKPKEV